jgi:LmbE family N-acetylglucosaminyl deacetylase
MLLSRRTVLAAAASSAAGSLLPASAPQRLRIVVAGGHPGDPECGCAGTIARYTELGHDVALLYLNRGEGYCGGESLDRCAEIRSAEAREACRILKARPLFAGQIDGRAVIDSAHYEAFGKILAEEKPDVVFTQWPVDSHPDHRAMAALTLDAWFRMKKNLALYFYEVAGDTSMFTATEFVDISGVEETRRAACYAHTSQQPGKWYPQQVEITKVRGATAGFRQAEGFARHPQSPSGLLPHL